MNDAITTFNRILLISLTMALCLGVAAVQARVIEKVAAVVNGEVITQTELDKAARDTLSEVRQNTPKSRLDEKLQAARQRILDEMIEDLLIKQKAEELQISVSEEDIDNAVATISSTNNLTVPELYRELERTGADREEYRRKLANQIRRSKLISYEIQSKIVVSEEEARDYYETEYTRQDTPRGYRLLQIGINWGGPESAADSKEKARKRLEGIRNLALQGQDFGELAKSFSELPSAKDGGDIGFFSEKEMAEAMRDTITGLEPGEISEIIETGKSFQFFRLLTRNLDGTPEFAPFDDVKEEIIDRLRQKGLEKRYDNWLKEIQEQAIIKKL
ncbi:MAG: SurA N-terminal domain-containing protein [Desulfurivibrionaceae bacterium]